MQTSPSVYSRTSTWRTACFCRAFSMIGERYNRLGCRICADHSHLVHEPCDAPLLNLAGDPTARAFPTSMIERRALRLFSPYRLKHTTPCGAVPVCTPQTGNHNFGRSGLVGSPCERSQATPASLRSPHGPSNPKTSTTLLAMPERTLGSPTA